MFAGIHNYAPVAPAAPDRNARALRRARRKLARLPHRRPHPPRPRVSPAVVEEEAASLLYGERTGTVHASPAVPPLGEAPDQPVRV